MDALLFVGNDETNWAEDREDLTDGQAFAHVHNYDYEYCSEIGSIGFELISGHFITDVVAEVIDEEKGNAQ